MTAEEFEKDTGLILHYNNQARRFSLKSEWQLSQNKIEKLMNST